MTIIQWFMPAVVGAIIGYITNWLAIKMLFRPYTEKRIGFFRIPFTPGLIPKEQDRIAYSVGQTIGEHLLTEEILTETIAGPKAQAQLRDIVNQLIVQLQEEDRTLDTWLQQLVGEEIHLFFGEWEEKALQWILDQCQDPKRQDQLAHWVVDQLKEEVQKPTVEEAIGNFQISPSTFEEVEEYLRIQGPTLAFYLQKIFHHPLVADKLKQFLTDVTRNQLGKMAAFLVNSDKIYERFLTELEKYMLVEANQQEMIEFFLQFIREKSARPFSDLLATVPPSLKEVVMLQGKEIFAQYETTLHQGLVDWMTNLITSEHTHEKLSDLLGHWKQSLFQRPVGDFFSIIKPNHVEMIQERMVAVYTQIVREKGGLAIQFLDIPTLVEDQIKSFEMAHAEKIILSIAKRELNAITWLGALLGFVMGIVINFL